MASLHAELTQPRKLPTRGRTLVFWVKAWGLRAQRFLCDQLTGIRQWPQEARPTVDWFPAWESRTALWLERDPQEQVLERGKVENLPTACARFDGVVVEAGGVFSFWRQLERAGKRRGFIEGRMLQQGCLIPAIGGGLCQLLNSLHELALRSSCEIVERHAHSARLPHMPLHDATVAWNYIDLRSRVRERTRIRARLTAAELILAFEGLQRPALSVTPAADRPAQESPSASHVRSCASCGEANCFRHREPRG